MDDFPKQMSSGSFESRSDTMFRKAKASGLVPQSYSKSDFASRVRNRYRGAGGAIIGEKRKKLADY
jgi:hypothetical protein